MLEGYNKKRIFIFMIFVVLLTLVSLFFNNRDINNFDSRNFSISEHNYTTIDDNDLFSKFDQELHLNVNLSEVDTCKELNDALLDEDVFSERVEDNIFLFEESYIIASGAGLCYSNNLEEPLCCYERIKYE